MPTHIGIGFSSTSNPVDAFKAAAIEAKSKTNAVHADFVLVFATETYASAEGIDALYKILQPSRLIGAVTPAVIIGEHVEPRGVGIMAIVSDEIRFAAGCQQHLNQYPARDAGYRLAQAILQDHHTPQRNAGIYLYDGLRRNGSLMCLGIREGLGSALPIVGAIGTDNIRADKTQNFFLKHVHHDSAVGILINGANTVCISAKHSWQPLGKPRIIDSADGNIIKTIDKEPAAKIYENYFPSSMFHKEPDAVSAPQPASAEHLEDIRLLYPLGIGTSKQREYLIRAPIDILPDGSIVCQGDVPTGSPVHLMITDKDACRKTIHDAAVDIRDQLLGKHPKFILVFESLMRRKVLGRNASQGLHTARELLGQSVPFFGMCTLGEVAPLGTLKNISTAQMLNGSFVLMAIG